MVFRRGSFSLPLSLLMSAFALVIPPANFSIHLHWLTRRSSTANSYRNRNSPVASVPGLAPLHLPRRPTRLVSYYAFFKGWLLLSQPPSCLSLPTSFPT
ncbi:hypothetical protein HALTITAN_3297 [Vreelandella titanicae BH1]|uniref:Uncharacterized protein n=1 Tax=Vreelandella titanicae BH1 TaxID=1204738 RepID=L9U5K2_9GAMM|nr:hypothetical protein HALTITAN_3297 [Halomonas titanicae BH1]